MIETPRADALEHEVIWGHIDILVVAVRRLSRWKVKTLLAGPSPTSPMKAEHLPYFQHDGPLAANVGGMIVVLP